MSITNTNATLIAWLRATYGGHIADNSRYKSRGTRQTCGVWRIMSRSAGLFLRDIRPYLRVKAPQADIALEFSELMRRQGPSKHGYGLEAIAKHEANRQQLRQLTAGDCRRRPAGAAADA